MSEEKKKLHVGCGRNILPGWINLDSASLPGIDIVYNLEDCGNKFIPLPDDSVDEFLLSHVIEHVNNSMGVMQELHRLAKPNAKCEIRVPYGSSDDAWEDPTHVRPYFLNSFIYFSQPAYWRADYGYRGDWHCETISLNMLKAKYDGLTVQQILPMLEKERNVVAEMVAVLHAVKPVREPKQALHIPPKISITLV